MDHVEAVQAQLAKWLTTELGPQFPDLTILDDWPDPGKTLSLPSISVITVGTPDTEPHAPMAHRVTPTTGPQGLLLYSFGRTMVSMQLDMLASNKHERNRLAKACSDAVNVNPIYSLPIPDALPDYRQQPGLMLYLEDFHGILADYQLEQVASPIEDSDAAQTVVWRATMTGDVIFHAVSVEQVALVKRIILRETLNGGAVEEHVIV
jgi:hypothetical protein